MVKDELDRMEHMGVISKVEEPTSWCAGMVVVPKKDKKVRICVDLKKLNENVREVHPLPKVDETLAGAKIFTQTVGSGRSHCQSHPDYSPPLSLHMGDTTYAIWNIKRHFQRRMSQILSGLQDVDG